MDKNERLQKRLKIISEATGWDMEKSKAEMDRAAGLGIPNGKYVLHQAWMFSDEELIELKEILDLQKEKQAKDEVWYANVVSEKSGWPYEKSLKMMRIAKKKGYPYKIFVRTALWKLSDEDIINLPQYHKEVSGDNKLNLEARQAKAKEYQDLIMQEMNWSLQRVRLESLKVKVMYGCNLREFCTYGIYRSGIETGKKYHNAEINERMNTRYADWGGENLYSFINKGRFYQEFSRFINRKWLINKYASFDEFKAKFAFANKIVYKPAEGLKGYGIEILDICPSNERIYEVYQELLTKPEGVVEEFIKQHAKVSEIYPHSVNTIRIMSFIDKGESKILNAVMKFATHSNVDNFSQGGIAVGIDVNSGVFCTDGVDLSGNIYELHPYSGRKLKGFQVPYWEEIVKTIYEAAKVHPEQPYIGWDVAVTPYGPEIVEGNNTQGPDIIQYPFAICNHEGKRHTIEPYLWF